MRCLQLDYGLLIFLQEQRIEKQIRRMQPELDLLIVLFLHRFYSYTGFKDKCELWSFESMTKIDSLIKRDYVDGIEIFRSCYRI